MRAWVGTAVIAFAALQGGGSAYARPTVEAAQISVEAQRVARGLEAQYQAALIRDRRLADDRELRLIADYEARLTQARRRADSRIAGAQAELERARADYAQLVETIALRDAASRAEIEAYRAEARGLAAQATPERLEALQRFADGDRVGAWPVLEALRLSEDRAIESAANARRAVRWRQDAELREIMRANGEATLEQTLDIWSTAASLDPTDFWTQVYLARGYRTLRRFDEARLAFERARALPQPTSNGPGAAVGEPTYVVLGEEVAFAVQLGDWERALVLSNARLQISRTSLAWILENLPGDDPGHASAESLFGRQVARDLLTRARVYEEMERNTEFLADLVESVAIRERIVQIDDTPDRTFELAVGRTELARALSIQGRKQEAIQQAVASFNALQEIIDRDASNVPAIRNQAGAALMIIGAVFGPGGSAQMDEASLVSILSTSQRNLSHVARADPNPENVENYVNVLEVSGRFLLAIGRHEEGWMRFREITRVASEMNSAEQDAALALEARGVYLLSEFGASDANWLRVIDLLERASLERELQTREAEMLRAARERLGRQ